MANTRTILTTFVLLVTLLILETENQGDFLSLDLLKHNEDHFTPVQREERNELHVQVEYEINLELNVTDVTAVDNLRSFMNNGSYYLALGPKVNVTQIDLITVCSLSMGNYQCRCEDQYFMPCDQCRKYGSCDNFTDDTCECISAIPPDGQYCQPVDRFNFTACRPTTTTKTTTAVTPSLPSTPSLVFEYLLSIELNTSDVTAVELLKDIDYSIKINDYIEISEVDVSTVCSLISGSYQCRCEDHYYWSCDQCLTYGSCDNIRHNTCGCISAIPPDGQCCQSVDQYNFTTCPLRTTTSLPKNATHAITTDSTPVANTNTSTSTRSATIITNSTPVAPLSMNTTPATTVTKTTFITTAMTSSEIFVTTTAAPSIVSEYLLSIELNATDVTAAMLLRNLSFPVSIDRNIQISQVNISTMCYPSGQTYQCRCVEHYGWPCHMCSTFGKCSDVLDKNCGCINAIPPHGSLCKPLQDLDPCPSPAPSTGSVTRENTLNLTTIASSTDHLTTTSRLSTNIISPTTNTIISTVPSVSTNTVYNTTIPIMTHTTATSTTPVPTSTTYKSTTFSTNSTTDFFITSNISTATVIPTTTNVTTAANISTTASVTSAPPIPTTTKKNATTSSTNTSTTTTNTPRTTFTSATTTVSTTKPATSTVSTTKSATTMVSTTTTSTYATTSSTSPTLTPTGMDMEMSVTLDMEFKPDYNNKDSTAYKDLESRIAPVLQKQYGGIKGFISVFVTGFRQGSVITDFTIKTSDMDMDQMAEANNNLKEAMRKIAPVIGSVVEQYYSPAELVLSPDLPDVTYTGQNMTLICGPPNFNISNVVWKFKRLMLNSERFKISTSGNQSTLTVTNVILSDAGLYECTLMGEGFYFHQNKTVSVDHIKAAPNVRVQSESSVKCLEGKTESLECCVQSPFKVKWYSGSIPLEADGTNCIKYNYTMKNCSGSTQKIFTCKVEEIPLPYEARTTLTVFTEAFSCKNDQYGTGRIGDKVSLMCDEGLRGCKTAECQKTGEWKLVKDTCILTNINQLLIQSEGLRKEELKNFTGSLSNAVKDEQKQIYKSSATISAIVNIINSIARVSAVINEDVMQNVLDTVDIIIGDKAKESWNFFNANQTQNSSSELLGALEGLSNRINGTFSIKTQLIHLKRDTFSNSFYEELNATVSIDIPDTGLSSIHITTIIFSTLDNVVLPRNSTYNHTYSNDTSDETGPGNAINAAVLLVKVNETIRNISLSYRKLNTSLLLNPQCVFWNFDLFDHFGAWDDDGCQFVSDINGTVTCSCSHLTSFSVLMSTDVPPSLKLALDVITYVGVGVSLASLVICLIIEGYVWKAITRNSTAFMRHVSIVNTALSLLMADICFIFGASIAKNPLKNPNGNYLVPVIPCSAATFFMHFSYLALFFWMLVSGLLLFYRTVMVFSRMSKRVMLAIGFTLGYGCPLIIAVTTVLVTAPGGGYIRKVEACWLNWFDTKAVLALVIPALTIVVINILILILVLFKMLRRKKRNSAHTEEKPTLVVIMRCVAILTPLFGLTWSLGVGTMVSPTDKGIHIAFAFFNSLQGFFILVFGTLFDSKIRSLLTRQMHTLSTGSNPTKDTSVGTFSFRGLNLINRLCGRRNIYHVSQVANSSSKGASESFNSTKINTTK